MTTPRRSFRTASVHSAGRTLDLKHPQNDKDPTRNAHDFNDPQGSIADGAGEAGEQIRTGIPLVIYNLTGIDVSSWDAFIASLNDGKGIDLPGLVAALELLGEIVEGVKDTIDNLMQIIIDAWNGIPTAVGGLLGNVWNAIAGILGVGQDAAATANNAMREITAIRGELQAGGDGESYAENLDYPNAAYLPAPYVVYESGPGSGSFGPNGNSALMWKQSGFSNRFCGYRRTEPTFSAGKFGCAMIIEQKAVNNGPAAYLGAVDASGNGIAMGVQQSAVSLNPVTAGIPGSALVSAAPGTANGDTYEMYYGATIGGVVLPHYLVVFRNGVALFKSNDISAGVTLADDLFLYVGVQAIGSGFVQTVPPRISSFTMFDSNYSAAA